MSVGVQRDEDLGLTQAVVGFAVPLPLFDRNRGNQFTAAARTAAWTAPRATVIEHALARIDGVLDANVSYAAEGLALEDDREKTSWRAVAARLEMFGYRIIPEHGGID